MIEVGNGNWQWRLATGMQVVPNPAQRDVVGALEPGDGGYLHAYRPGRVALVYDLIEPLRPHVDRLVLEFVQGCTFAPRDFILTERGVCRLHPQLARTIARLTMSDAAVQEVIAAAMLELTRLV